MNKKERGVSVFNKNKSLDRYDYGGSGGSGGWCWLEIRDAGVQPVNRLQYPAAAVAVPAAVAKKKKTLVT
ncbi:hypothetical protein M0802_012868 [Mischocyttarus mexicanus]|nr:hypothetical protein M0802_012868 [Mischocyttarus mexicanus]